MLMVVFSTKKLGVKSPNVSSICWNIIIAKQFACCRLKIMTIKLTGCLVYGSIKIGYSYNCGCCDNYSCKSIMRVVI